MKDIIKKHLAAFTDGNWDEFKESLAPQVVYEEAATMLRSQGSDDYVKAIQGWRRAFPDIKVNILALDTSETKVFAEVEWEGTQSGPLEGPFGSIPATNMHGTLKAVLIYTVANNKITELHHYFDLFTLLRQLGVAPTAPAPSVRPEAQPQPQPH